MGRKNRDREISRLRAQVEFLKAQLKTLAPEKSASAASPLEPPTLANPGPAPSQREIFPLSPAYLRQDLRKTLWLTLFALIFLTAASLMLK